jgi:hypothetical protein
LTDVVSEASVTFKDLCIDALDVDAQSRFWAAATGLEVAGPVAHRHLTGPTPRHTVWVNEVDRPHVVKNRVHLDVDCVSVDELVALGARVLSPAVGTGLPWSVLADPEGNELCAFERPAADVPAYRLHGVVVDSVDPGPVARWWGERFGVEAVAYPEHGLWSVPRIAVDRRMTIDFVTVPEPRTVPNRVHWDVVGDVDALLGAGATHLHDQPRWTVLADPEGNEFCVFPPA